MKSKKIKIIHFITLLGLGGAEKVLYNLIENKTKNFELKKWSKKKLKKGLDF